MHTRRRVTKSNLHEICIITVSVMPFNLWSNSSFPLIVLRHSSRCFYSKAFTLNATHSKFLLESKFPKEVPISFARGEGRSVSISFSNEITGRPAVHQREIVPAFYSGRSTRRRMFVHYFSRLYRRCPFAGILRKFYLNSALSPFDLCPPFEVQVSLRFRLWTLSFVSALPAEFNFSPIFRLPPSAAPSNFISSPIPRQKEREREREDFESRGIEFPRRRRNFFFDRVNPNEAFN